jgi:hypothetical protein
VPGPKFGTFTPSRTRLNLPGDQAAVRAGP